MGIALMKIFTILNNRLSSSVWFFRYHDLYREPCRRTLSERPGREYRKYCPEDEALQSGQHVEKMDKKIAKEK